jgi:O-antigen ligase
MAEFLAAPLLTMVQDIYKIEIVGLSLLQWMRGGILGAMLVCLAHVSIPERRNLRFFAPIVLLALYSAALTILAIKPMDNVIATIRMAYPCLVGVAAYALFSRGAFGERAMERLAWFWLLAYFGSQMIALRSGQTAYESQYAAAGLGSSASAADGLILLIPFFLLAGRWRPRDLLGVAIALIAASLTMRRTAMLGVLAAALVGAMVRALRRGSGVRAKLVAIGLPAAIFLAFVYALTATGWGTDFSARLADMDFRRGGTGAGRTTVWQGGIDHLLRRGVMLNVIGEGEGSYAEAMVHRIGFSVGAHNGWLTLAVSYGLIGTALYLVFLGRLGRFAMRARHVQDSRVEVLGAVLAGILISEATQGFLLSPSAVPTYTMIALMLVRRSASQPRVRRIQGVRLSAGGGSS